MHVHAPATKEMGRILRISLALTLAYIVLTLIVGLRAHSLALISEAGHNASDFLALLLSAVAVFFHSRPATDRKTFGYRRAGVLAAFVNGITLIAISAWIAVEAVDRLVHPLIVAPRPMMITAAIGVAMNGVIAWMLSRASHDLNIRAAFIHMLGDTLSTASIIIGAVAIAMTGIEWIDPMLSLLIAAMILWSSIAIVRETLNILLEGTPKNLSLGDIRTVMRKVSGVCDVHDLHVWSLGSGLNALACHVTIPDIPPSESRRILTEINVELREHFQIHHTTIQFEPIEDTECDVEDGCLPLVVEVHEHTHAHGH